MKGKVGRSPGSVSITMECSECERPVENVNYDAQSVLCFKCVARQLNPYTRFMDDAEDKYAKKPKTREKRC
jgi:hypothetical protein